MKKSTIIRIALGILSIFFLYMAGVQTITTISQLLSTMQINGPLALFSTNLSTFTPIIIYFAIFIILITITFIWSEIFKSISKQLVTFGLIFISLSFIFFPVSNHAQEMSQSVQPMIDSMAIKEIEKMLTEANFPTESLKTLGIDLSIENQTEKAQQLATLRESCKTNQIQVKELCEGIMLTDYNTLIKTMKENPQFMQAAQQLNQDSNLPENLTLEMKGFESIEEIETTLSNYKSTGYKFLFLGIFLILLAIPIYYLHFKIFSRELISMHIPYFIAKTNLFYFIPSFILVVIFYLIIKTEILLNYLLNSPIEDAIQMMINSPLYSIVLQINQEIFNLNLIYLIISIIIYSALLIILKKQIQNNYNPQTPNANTTIKTDINTDTQTTQTTQTTQETDTKKQE